jgi:hypothetical protein
VRFSAWFAEGRPKSQSARIDKAPSLLKTTMSTAQMDDRMAVGTHRPQILNGVNRIPSTDRGQWPEMVDVNVSLSE